VNAIPWKELVVDKIIRAEMWEVTAIQSNTPQ
jgi:hypothetical protein